MLLSILCYYNRIRETGDFDGKQVHFLTLREQGASPWQPMRAFLLYQKVPGGHD